MVTRVSAIAVTAVLLLTAQPARASGFFGTMGFHRHAPATEQPAANIPSKDSDIVSAPRPNAVRRILRAATHVFAPSHAEAQADDAKSVAGPRDVAAIAEDQPDITLAHLEPASGGTEAYLPATARSYAPQAWVARSDLISEDVMGHKLSFGPFVKYRDASNVSQLAGDPDMRTGLTPVLTGLQCGAQLRIGFK